MTDPKKNIAPTPMRAHEARKSRPKAVVRTIVLQFAGYSFASAVGLSFLGALMVWWSSPLPANADGDFEDALNYGMALTLPAWAVGVLIVWLVCWIRCRKDAFSETNHWKAPGPARCAALFMLGWYASIAAWTFNPNSLHLGRPAIALKFVPISALSLYLLIVPFLAAKWLWTKAVRENVWRSAAVLK